MGEEGGAKGSELVGGRIEVEETFEGGGEHRAGGGFGMGGELGDGAVEDLTDQAVGDAVKVGALGRGEFRMLGKVGVEFGTREVVGVFVEGLDERPDVARGEPAEEIFDVGVEEFFGGGDFGGAFVAIAGGDVLEVIDVVEVDVVEFADGGFDIAGDGQVDDDSGAIAAGFEEGFEMGDGEEGDGGAGGGEDDVGGGEEGVEGINRGGGGVKLGGHGLGAIERAVGDEDALGSEALEVFEHEAGHLSGADAEDGFVMEAV